MQVALRRELAFPPCFGGCCLQFMLRLTSRVVTHTYHYHTELHTHTHHYHTELHTHTHTHTHQHTHTHNTHTQKHTHTHTHTYTHTHTQQHTSPPTCLRFFSRL